MMLTIAHSSSLSIAHPTYRPPSFRWPSNHPEQLGCPDVISFPPQSVCSFLLYAGRPPSEARGTPSPRGDVHGLRLRPRPKRQDQEPHASFRQDRLFPSCSSASFPISASAATTIGTPSPSARHSANPPSRLPALSSCPALPAA
jgi:hypothetical protein